MKEGGVIGIKKRITIHLPTQVWVAEKSKNLRMFKAEIKLAGADFWEGGTPKHFSVKKWFFSEEGRGIQ